MPQIPPIDRKWPVPWREIGRLALIGLAYWLTVRLGLFFVAQPENIASIWPASGLALAALLLRPKREWPQLLAVIFVVNAAGNWGSGNNLPISLGFAGANVLEAALAAWALIYLCKTVPTFRRPLEVFALLAVATLVNGLTALVGAAIPMLAFGAPFLKTWQIWWTANGLGMLLVTPVILTWVNNPDQLRSITPRRLLEAVLLVFVLALFAALLFGPFTQAEKPLLRNYMLFPFLIWLAFKFSPRGMAATLLMFASIAVWNTLHGYGIFAFADQTRSEHLVSLQVYLCIETFSGLVLSAMVTQHKTSEAALRCSEENLNKAQHFARLGNWTWHIQTGQLDWSDEMYVIFGLDKRAFTGSLPDVIARSIHPDDRAAVDASNASVANEGKPIPLAYRVVWNDGSIHTVWAEAGELLLDADGRPVSLSGTVQDITERKQREEALRESEERFKNAFRYSAIGMALVSTEGKWLKVNPSLCEIVGYSEEEMLAKTFQDITHPDDLDMDLGYMRRMLGGEIDAYTMEKRYIHKTGQTVWVVLALALVRGGGGAPLYFINQVQDITARKQTEEDLRQVNERFILATRAAGLGVWDWDIPQNKMTWDDGMYALYGIKKADFIGAYEAWLNGLHPDDLERGKAEVAQAQRGEKEFDTEFRVVWPAGSIHHIKAYGQVIRDANGSPLRMIGINYDITARKQAEAALQESEARYRRLVEGAPDVVYTFSSKRGCVYCSPRVEQVLGYSVEHLYAHPFLWNESIHPADRENINAVIHEFEAGKFFDTEYRILDASGNWRWLRDRSIGRDIGAGEVLIEGMATDITAGKQIEHELSAKTHMLESVFESAPYIMMLVNAEGRVTDINRIGVQFANRDKEKLLGLLGGEVFGCLNSFYGPGCGKNQICLSCPVRSRFAHTFETGEPIYEGEGQLEIIKDNVKICLDILISTALVETANDRHVLVTIADITARKQAEQALKLRESYLTAIVENQPGLVWLKDSQGRFLTVNQAFATSCGKTSPTDLVGRTDLDIWPPELAEKYRADDANVIQGKTPVVVEELVFAQGQNTWFETFKTPILDDQNDILGTTGYSRDITARKQAEDAIKKSEERYRSLFDNMTEGFALHELIFDEKGAPRDYRFLDVNRAFEQLTGLQRESIVGKGQREVLPAEDEFWFRTYCRVALTGESVYLDNFSPALQRHYEVYSYSPAPNQFAVVFIDVTARKKAETALRESEQRYRAVADSASDAIITADSVGNVVGWNPSAEKMFGYSEAEINGKPLTILLPAQFQGLHLNGMERVQSGGERRIIGTTVEVEGHRKDGSEFPLELSLAEWQVTSGQFYTAILRDITARKRDERQIKTALADKEILLRELYHRTKNNMQVICAMLELQADNVTDELALRVFRETENKIRSMALIHQMLYQSQNLSSIDLKEYLDELATLLLKSYKIHPGRIALTLDMESVPVLIDFATPCGLIVNELMSNALKYAFPGERKGKISLGLAKSAAGFITLRFSDDGVGLPPGFDLRRAETLGLQTVLALGERQLHGQVTFIQENGLTCQIRFQDTLYEARV